MDPLNIWIRELQRQAHAQRLELDDANGGYEESRKEQVRQEEKLALRERERALRDTRIRNVHEMEELEVRVEECSLQKLGESHATILELTSQIQDLQERAHCMNDSREFQDVESNYSGIFLTFPVHQQSFQVLDQC